MHNHNSVLEHFHPTSKILYEHLQFVPIITLSPRQPLIYFPSIYICLFWTFCKDRIISYMTFCIWLLSFIIMFSGASVLQSVLVVHSPLLLNSIPLNGYTIFYLPIHQWKNICFYFCLFFSFLVVLGLPCCAGKPSRGEWGSPLSFGAEASHCSGFSCFGAQAPGAWASAVATQGSWSTSSVNVVHRLSSVCGMWNLLRPGIELVSPAPVDKFLSMVPPGKSFLAVINNATITFTYINLWVDICFHFSC